MYSLRAKSETPYVSMPVTWEELVRPKNLYFAPDEAVARLRKVGDLFAPVLKMKQRLEGERASRPQPAGRPVRRYSAARDAPREASGTLAPLPKPNSQSGRRLFLVVKGDSGAYEIIEGSRVLQGEWILEKVSEAKEHRSWRLVPQAAVDTR